MSDERTARRGDWRTNPLPAQHVTLPVGQAYSAEEMAHIRRGTIPEVMEDKWFIFFEDDTLHCHRSWTGNCIYQARFAARDGGAVCTDVRANRDPAQYTLTDDDEDIRSFLDLVKYVLLHGWD